MFIYISYYIYILFIYILFIYILYYICISYVMYYLYIYIINIYIIIINMYIHIIICVYIYYAILKLKRIIFQANFRLKFKHITQLHPIFQLYIVFPRKNTIFIPLSSSRARTALPGREARTAKAPWSCNRFNRSTILDGPQTKTICH